MYHTAVVATFRINELANLTALALDESRFGQNSGRVREVPDVRTIRYYTTLGLLDRPLEMQGRTAFYGPRHLLQLLAVKRLQAEGRSLTEIQQTLASATDRMLQRIVDLSESRLKELQDRVQQAAQQTEAPTARQVQQKRASAFWTQQPRVNSTSETPNRTGTISPAAVIHLAQGVSLLFDGVHPRQFDEQTVSRLQPVIAELLQALQSAGVTPATSHELLEAEQ